jgi:hypothetical protein
MQVHSPFSLWLTFLLQILRMFDVGCWLAARKITVDKMKNQKKPGHLSGHEIMMGQAFTPGRICFHMFCEIPRNSMKIHDVTLQATNKSHPSVLIVGREAGVLDSTCCGHEL